MGLSDVFSWIPQKWCFVQLTVLHVCAWGLGNSSVDACGFGDVDSCLASMWRLRILCQCHNSWPSAMVAIMETSIHITTPCFSQMVLNGAWAKALFSFYPVLSETCSCWLRWTVWDSSLCLIFPWMKHFRLENKDVQGRWESSYPWQSISAVFPFNPKRDFPNWSCSPTVAKVLLCLTCFPFMLRKMHCEITTSLPSVIWRNTVFGFYLTQALSLELKKDAGGVDLLLTPGQAASVQVW